MKRESHYCRFQTSMFAFHSRVSSWSLLRAQFMLVSLGSQLDRSARVFFERVHLSPMKLNISFSLSGGEEELARWTGVRDVIIIGDVVRHLVASVGAIADVRDADVRCASAKLLHFNVKPFS